MKYAVLFLACSMVWTANAAYAQEDAKLKCDSYSGYFVSNKFEPKASESYVVMSDQKQFDKVFGVAKVMNDKSHRLPKNAFKTHFVAAVIKRGPAVWTYKVGDVIQRDGVVEMQYTATSEKSDSATFASPLIVTIPKGTYTAVQFVENDQMVKLVRIKKL